MEAKYIKLIGTKGYFNRCWGIGWVDTKQPITIVALIPYFNEKYLEIGKRYILSTCPNVTDGVFSLKGKDLTLKEWKPASNEEIKQLNKAMDKCGFYWGPILSISSASSRTSV